MSECENGHFSGKGLVNMNFGVFCLKPRENKVSTDLHSDTVFANSQLFFRVYKDITGY